MPHAALRELLDAPPRAACGSLEDCDHGAESCVGARDSRAGVAGDFRRDGAWRAAIVRGQLLREDENGFAILTAEGREERFRPARAGPGDRFELNPAVKDFVAPFFLGMLVRCDELPAGAYECVALTHEGREVVISSAPVERPL